MNGLMKSFVYAFQGIIASVKTQRNLRIHLVAVIYVTAFSCFYNLSKTDYVMLVLTFVTVISLELVNTAIEKTVDICSPQFNRLAKMAKDCAAAAVLISAIGAVIVGVLLFADTEIIKGILFFYSENLIALIGLLLFTALALLFIFIPAGKYERKK